FRASIIGTISAQRADRCKMFMMKNYNSFSINWRFAGKNRKYNFYLVNCRQDKNYY
ncbi:hypothetical protein L9F63_020004, partial [Diploptera punctata]